MKAAGGKEEEGAWSGVQRAWADGCLAARRAGGKAMLGERRAFCWQNEAGVK